MCAQPLEQRTDQGVQLRVLGRFFHQDSFDVNEPAFPPVPIPGPVSRQSAAAMGSVDLDQARLAFAND
ncbi:hypothetical protein DDJ31_29595 [Streptomyces griseoviridis]|uniref:Uncharacterized protein n=1 Tax=Streptomyces griseoviridis TaxID=45398 RepID=A0ABX5U2F8_STRGD|nr:hypothetical protein DDJ31_29595 [Streptomyces griseoviridis]